MSVATFSTKRKLLGAVKDLEIIIKDIFEKILLPRQQKGIGKDLLKLSKLLLKKLKELDEIFKLASEQIKIHQHILAIKEELDRQDTYILNFQKNLKDAENIIATALFQAKIKLSSIDRANKRPVLSEDLIKYAHRISSAEAICAPLTWQPGDPRRPYPTDIDMRKGFLSTFKDGMMPPLQMMNSYKTEMGSGMSHNQFVWHPNGNLHMNVPGQKSVPIDTGNRSKENEDVEVMSTDSSSSSSSDSQ